MLGLLLYLLCKLPASLCGLELVLPFVVRAAPRAVCELSALLSGPWGSPSLRGSSTALNSIATVSRLAVTRPGTRVPFSACSWAVQLFACKYLQCFQGCVTQRGILHFGLGTLEGLEPCCSDRWAV